MTVMLKKFSRLKRNKFIIIVVIILSFVYFMREPDLDVTRKHIETNLQEALKEEKGSGCDIPHLDPFAFEVTQFDKEVPKVFCDGKDWVKCYLHECRVQKSILKTTNNIRCLYSDIIYESDSKYVVGEPTLVLGGEPYILTRSDHVKIECTGKHENSYFLPSKWLGHGIGYRTTVERRAAPPGREDSIDVLIFGFDSTSKNGFIRRMPKSYEFLVKELGVTVLNGYNILGDGTPAALFPILTGKTELELPDVRRKLTNQETLDDKFFLFYTLKEYGYHTSFFEDEPFIGTFQYRFNGFRRQPADHYMRPFSLQEFNDKKGLWGKSKKFCVGDVPGYALMMNITDQFFKLPGKHFCFTFIVDITHDDFNMISTADDATVEFLKALKSDGRLDNTLLFVMSDHGARFAKVRNTVQGKLEERLPLMAIRLPEKLTKKRPKIQANLDSNVDVLTTAHDIYATILDALDLNQHKNLYKIDGADIYRGLSLFEEIPKSRSCSEAGIEPHWCACLKWKNVPRDDKLFQLAAEAFVDYINFLTKDVRSKCVPRTLTTIFWVYHHQANSKLLQFKESDSDGYVAKFGAKTKPTSETYQVKVVVGPGIGIYEASAVYNIEQRKFIYNARDISRVNAYNDEPSCISTTQPHLNMYCYCAHRS